jgi:hypothetical protein
MGSTPPGARTDCPSSPERSPTRRASGTDCGTVACTSFATDTTAAASGTAAAD